MLPLVVICRRGGGDDRGRIAAIAIVVGVDLCGYDAGVVISSFWRFYKHMRSLPTAVYRRRRVADTLAGGSAMFVRGRLR